MLLRFTHVGVVSFSNFELTVDQFNDLRRFSKLKNFSATRARIGDRHLQRLAPLPQLTRLNLNRNPVSDLGGRELRRATRMELLELSETGITDETLAVLASLPKLRQLSLNKTDVTDAGASAMLREMRRPLERLEANDTGVGDDSLRELALRHSRLVSLSLSSTRVTDAGLADLSKLENLKSLALQRTDVTDAGIRRLQNCRRLDTLSLCETRVTDAGLADLLPELVELKLLHLAAVPAGEKTYKALQGHRRLRSILVGNIEETAVDALTGIPTLASVASRGDALSPLVVQKLFQRMGNVFFIHGSKVDDDLMLAATQSDGSYRIESLALTGPGVSDRSIPALLKLKNLRRLTLRNTAVTDDGAAALRTGLPEIQFER